MVRKKGLVSTLRRMRLPARLLKERGNTAVEREPVTGLSGGSVPRIHSTAWAVLFCAMELLGDARSD